MQTHVVLVSILLTCTQLKGQIPAETTTTYPPFKLQRSEEDFSFLKNGLPGDNFWEKLKYVALADKIALSIGGDARSQFQLFGNEDWEYANNDEVLFLRYMVHADVHFSGKIRLFGQLKSGIALGRDGPPSSLDKDQLDLHQLFIGLKWAASVIEMGRRELLYGSRRLLDVREGTNVRQSFDGGRWIWQRQRKRLDLLFYTYNPPQTGVFDNEINADQLLWGGYFVWNAAGAGALNFDFYCLGVRNVSPRFEEGNQRETRHSFGVRHWGGKGKFRYNNEVVFQTGRFGGGSIKAWTISTDLSYTLPGRLKPTPGLKAEIISGDGRHGDGDLNTFNALYPRGGYFGLLALIGPANLMDIHPSAVFCFGQKWSLNLDWDFFWRQSLNDGIYFPSGRLNVPGSGSQERFVGHQPGAQLTFGAHRFLELEASVFYFLPGGFLAEVTEGAPLSQAGISATFKF